MKIYIAGFFDTRARLRPHAERLGQLGHKVVSEWIWTPEGFSMERPEAAWDDIAERDLVAVAEADLLIVDTFDVTPRGGREVELGWALGKGIAASVIGPRRNVFHHLCPAYESWEEFFEERMPNN